MENAQNDDAGADYLIAEAKPADAQAVYDFLAEQLPKAWPDLDEKKRAELERACRIDVIKKSIPRGAVIARSSGGKIAGLAGPVDVLDRNEFAYFITINPDWQRKGIGRALVLAVQDMFFERNPGEEKLKMLCGQSQVDFYGHFHFEPSGFLKVDFLGEEMNFVIMRREKYNKLKESGRNIDSTPDRPKPV